MQYSTFVTLPRAYWCVVALALSRTAARTRTLSRPAGHRPRTSHRPVRSARQRQMERVTMRRRGHGARTLSRLRALSPSAPACLPGTLAFGCSDARALTQRAPSQSLASTHPLAHRNIAQPRTLAPTRTHSPQLITTCCCHHRTGCNADRTTTHSPSISLHEMACCNACMKEGGVDGPCFHDPTRCVAFRAT
jgi:hypothetical protein